MRLPLPMNSTLIEVDQDSIMGNVSPYSGPLFIFLLLCFYALALWDRWLNLKLKTEENRRLHVAIGRLESYGTMASTVPLVKNSKTVMPPQRNAEAGSQINVSTDFLTVPKSTHPTPPPSPPVRQALLKP